MGSLRLGVMCGVRDRRDLDAGLDAALAVGVRYVQLTAAAPLSADAWRDILGRCRERGVTVAAIGCYANLVRPEDRSLHGVAVADVEPALRALADAGEGHLRQVVVWSGTFGADLLAGDRRNWTLGTWDALVETAASLARKARALGGRVLIEPYHRHCLVSARDYVLFLRDALEAAGLPWRQPAATALGVVLDPPNLLASWQLTDLEQTLADGIAALGPWAGMVHLKDIAAPADDRTTSVPALPAPGEGRIAYAAYVRQMAAAASGELPAIAEHFDTGDPGALRRVMAFLEAAGVPR